MKVIISILILCATLHQSQAFLPSIGGKTAEQVRCNIPKSDFVISLEKNFLLISEPGFQSRLVDISKAPSLTVPDVQMAMADVYLQPGKTFVRHSHPRGAELLYVAAGTLKSRLVLDPVTKKTATLLAGVGEFLVYPQGTIHDFSCISKEPCKAIATFNTADPGFIPV